MRTNEPLRASNLSRRSSPAQCKRHSEFHEAIARTSASAFRSPRLLAHAPRAAVPRLRPRLKHGWKFVARYNYVEWMCPVQPCLTFRVLQAFAELLRAAQARRTSLTAQELMLDLNGACTRSLRAHLGFTRVVCSAMHAGWVHA